MSALVPGTLSAATIAVARLNRQKSLAKTIFRKRPAYRYTVKHSIYVHHLHLHEGIGRQLLPALIDACGVAGYRQMVAYIDSANTPSLQLHEAFGFERMGELRGVGYKFGHWTNTVLLQRALGDGAASLPGPLAR
jgi:L-amino acid N-acyltransferase YncA